MPTNTTVLTKEQLQKIELGLSTLQKLKEVGGLNKIAISRGPGAGPVECEAVALVVEAAILIWNVYNYTKFNQFEHQEFFQKQIESLKTLDLKSKYTLQELTTARQALNKY